MQTELGAEWTYMNTESRTESFTSSNAAENDIEDIRCEEVKICIAF